MAVARCRWGMAALIALALWSAAAVAVERDEAAAAAPRVIVLSWDGVRHDYPDWAAFPGLDRLARDGVRGNLASVYPSNTFPTHVSLATGTYPDVHGIVNNFFLEDGKRYVVGDADWIHAEPMWIAAERQGVKAATYFWVGSESDWRGQGQSHRIAPFARHPERRKVRQILEWMDLPDAAAPRLIMSYWAGADTVGHRSGPIQEAIVPQLRGQDAALQTLLDGLDARRAWPHTTLLLVSDHGFTATGQLIDIVAILGEAGVPARTYGGALAQVYLQDAAQLEDAERVLGAVPNVAVHRPNALPAEWRLAWPSRLGDLVVATTPPHVLTADYAAMRGGHGYAPTHPDMVAAFFALGRGVGPLPPAVPLRPIDLAATIAALLGIEPPAQSEGVPMGWLRLPKD